MQRPSPRPALVVAVLSPLSLVLSHNLAFLLSYGSEMHLALRATGHDGAWSDAANLVVACSAALGLAGGARIAVLWLAVRRLGREAGGATNPGWRGFGSLLLRAWLGILAVTTAWYLVQEHLERLAVGQVAPLLDPLLAGGLGGPLLVIPAVSLLAALVGALFRWSVSALLARLTAAGRPTRVRRRPVSGRRPAGRVTHPSALLARRLGLRAPPMAGVA